MGVGREDPSGKLQTAVRVRPRGRGNGSSQVARLMEQQKQPGQHSVLEEVSVGQEVWPARQVISWDTYNPYQNAWLECQLLRFPLSSLLMD